MCEIATSASLFHYLSTCLTPFGHAGEHHSSVTGVWKWVCVHPAMLDHAVRTLGLTLYSWVESEFGLSSKSLLFSVFQSESEQDEEGTGSMGSATVAVSPVCVFSLSFCGCVSKIWRDTSNRSKSKDCWSQCRVITGVSIPCVNWQWLSVIYRKQIRGL